MIKIYYYESPYDCGITREKINYDKTLHSIYHKFNSASRHNFERIHAFVNRISYNNITRPPLDNNIRDIFNYHSDISRTRIEKLIINDISKTCPIVYLKDGKIKLEKDRTKKRSIKYKDKVIVKNYPKEYWSKQTIQSDISLAMNKDFNRRFGKILHKICLNIVDKFEDRISRFEETRIIYTPKKIIPKLITPLISVPLISPFGNSMSHISIKGVEYYPREEMKSRLFHLIRKTLDALDTLKLKRNQMDEFRYNGLKNNIEEIYHYLNSLIKDLDDFNFSLIHVNGKDSLFTGKEKPTNEETQLRKEFSTFPKLHFNGQSNTLINIFYQLKKTLVNSKNEPYINDSDKIIAEYLKGSFDNFEKTTAKTIETVLSKENKQLKNPNKKILILREKDLEL